MTKFWTTFVAQVIIIMLNYSVAGLRLEKSTCTVSKWCANSSQPGLSTQKRTAELLDVDVKDLLWSTK